MEFEHIQAVVDRCKRAAVQVHCASASLFDAMSDLGEILSALGGEPKPEEVSPPCDVEPQDVPHPTFTDATHHVYREGEPVYSGTKGECQTFADNAFPSGGYGIGPIPD